MTRVGRCARHAQIAAVVLLSAGIAQAQPSASGGALLAAGESARATVLGRVDGVRRLDRSGYTATVLVERVLAGEAQPGSAVAVAWEELGTPERPRLADQQRVLVALVDLPSGSLWRQRFPPGTDARAIAARGDAVLVDPAASDVDLVAAYLQLGAAAAPAARAGALARIAAGATPLVAGAAVARLAALPGAGAALEAAAVASLMGAAADARKPLALRRAIVAFAGQTRLTAALPGLEALARPDSALEADALIAIGEIRGGMPATQVEALLDSPRGPLRAAGARFATGSLAERRLPPLVRADPDPQVRAAAATTLAATNTVWGIDGAVPALADADPTVRSAAARALGRLGAAAVPALEAVARSQPAAARGAITALSLAGPSGVAAVRRLAADHPDHRLRDFARLALGQGPPAH